MSQAIHFTFSNSKLIVNDILRKNDHDSMLSALTEKHKLEEPLSGLTIKARTSKRRTGGPTYRIYPVVERNQYIQTSMPFKGKDLPTTRHAGTEEEQRYDLHS
jgi:hypothetical protein